MIHPAPWRRAAAHLLLALSTALVVPAFAQDVATPAQAAQPAADRDRPLGAATRDWLALQRSGRAAGTAHPVPGEIATLTWRRYVDSFRQPIPESFNSAVRDADKSR